MNTARTAPDCERAKLGQKHARAGVVMLALLATVATAPEASAQQGWTDETFEQVIFQQDLTAAAARRRLDSELSGHVNEIDRVCRLTEAQKQKLHLAGRGDIHRFFDLFETAKEEFRLAGERFHKEKVQPAGDKVAERLARAELMMQMEVELMQCGAPLQPALQEGLFQEHSLLYKSLGRTLTDEQAARYEVLKAERRASRHRASIERVVAQFGQDVLRDEQRRDLIRLLAEEIKPPRKATPSPYDSYYTLYMMGRIPEGRLKPLLDPQQWAVVSRRVNRYQRLEAALRQRGLLPD